MRTSRMGRGFRLGRRIPAELHVWVVSLGLAVAMLHFSAGVRAETSAPAKTAEGIAAVVGDRPILRSEVEEQFQSLAPQMQVDPADTAASNGLRREILGRLVDDQVLVLEAKSQSIEVTEEEVRQEVQQAIQNNIEQLGGADAFQAQLKKEGLTQVQLEQRYTDEARKQLLAQRLIQKEVRPKINLSEEDVKRFYQDNRDRLPKKPRSLHLYDLFILVRPDSVLDLRARDRAAAAKKAIAGGMSFAEAAKQNSDAPDAPEGGHLGRFTKDDLDGDFERAAFSVPVGQVSDPVRSRYGWHVLKVTDRDPQGEWVELDHILAEVTPTRSDINRTVDRVNTVRASIVSGKTTFADAVRSYSDDEDSRGKDGDLGWIPITALGGAIKDVVDTLRVGRVSLPVSDNGGVHLVKLVGEEAEGSYAFDEVKDELRQMAGQQALETNLRGYLDQLRTKYFVEVRAQF